MGGGASSIRGRFLLYSVEVEVKKWAARPFFFGNDGSRRIARAHGAPAGVRARRLGGRSRGEARPRVHRQAGRGERRRLRARVESPDAGLRGRERGFRSSRSVLAGPRAAASKGR